MIRLPPQMEKDLTRSLERYKQRGTPIETGGGIAPELNQNNAGIAPEGKYQNPELNALLSQPEEVEAPGVIESGLRGSASGILTGQGLSLEEQEALARQDENDPDWVRGSIRSLISMAADVPVFAAGGLGGTAVGGPVGGAAGAFALPAAIQEYWQKYLESRARGDTSLSFEDWIDVAKGTGKSAAIGAGLGVVSPFIQFATRNPAMAKFLKTPLSQKMAESVLESGYLTGAGALAGEELSLENFRDNLIAIAGFNISKGLIGKLHKIHKQTGKPVEEIVQEHKPEIEKEKLLEYKPKKEEKISPEPTKEQLLEARARKADVEKFEEKKKQQENLNRAIKKENERRKELGLKPIKKEEIVSEPSFKESDYKRDQILRERTEKDLFEKPKEKLEKYQARKKSLDRTRLDLMTEITDKVEKDKSRIKKAEDRKFISEMAEDLQKQIKELKERDQRTREQEVILKAAETIDRRLQKLLGRKAELPAKINFEGAKLVKKEAFKPLESRVQNAIQGYKGEIQNAKKKLNRLKGKRFAGEERAAIQEQIKQAEADIKELERNAPRRPKKTLKESTRAIEKESGSRNYQEKVTQNASEVAENILRQAEQKQIMKEFNEAAKKDLKDMGIDLRCL